MGRSGPELTREHADKIVRKLKATVEAGRAHDLAIVHYQGTPVVQFGIRRASRKDEGHGHLSGQLSLPAFQVQRLANCPMSYEEWVDRMKAKGVIPPEDPSEG